MNIRPLIYLTCSLCIYLAFHGHGPKLNNIFPRGLQQNPNKGWIIFLYRTYNMTYTNRLMTAKHVQCDGLGPLLPFRIVAQHVQRLIAVYAQKYHAHNVLCCLYDRTKILWDYSRPPEPEIVGLMSGDLAGQAVRKWRRIILLSEGWLLSTRLN